MNVTPHQPPSKCFLKRPPLFVLFCFVLFCLVLFNGISLKWTARLSGYVSSFTFANSKMKILHAKLLISKTIYCVKLHWLKINKFNIFKLEKADGDTPIPVPPREILDPLLTGRTFRPQQIFCLSRPVGQLGFASWNTQIECLKQEHSLGQTL